MAGGSRAAIMDVGWRSRKAFATRWWERKEDLKRKGWRVKGESEGWRRVMESGVFRLGFDQIYEFSSLLAKLRVIEADFREVIAGVVLCPELFGK